MNAIQKLFQQLRERFPDQAEALIAEYRANAAADSRASHHRQKERTQRMRAEREALRQKQAENHD